MKPKRKDGGHWDNEYPSGLHEANKNMVCFDCRYIKRVRIMVATNDVFICPTCRKPLTSMFCKIELPKKDDIKAWKKLKG